MTEPNAAPESRNPLGWIVLAFLFLLIAANSVMRADAPRPDGPKSWEQEQIQLSNGLGIADNAFAGDQARQTIAEVLEKAKKAPANDRMAARLRVVTSKYLKAKVRPEDLAFLQRSQIPEVTKRLGRTPTPAEGKEIAERDAADRALAQGLAKGALTPAEADRLAAKIPDEPFVFRFGKALVRQAAGQGDAAKLAVPPAKTILRGIGGLIIIVVILGVIAAWGVFLLGRPILVHLFAEAAPAERSDSGTGFDFLRFRDRRGAGRLIPPNALGADRLAIRAAQLFGGFVALSTVLGMSPLRNVESVATLVQGIAMIAFVPLLFRTRVNGHRLTMGDIGLCPGRPLLLIGLGVFGFLLELPVSLGLGALGMLLFRFLPPPEHPATNALRDHPSLLTIGTMFFLACVVAPFWEEVMFRGCLFPAVSRLLKSPIAGGLVSSFLFASIHPQGVVLWFALASVGAFSCILAYRTNHLLPSIVMHFCHNALLVVVTVLFAS